MIERIELVLNVRPQLVINGIEVRTVPEDRLIWTLPAVCSETEVRTLVHERDRRIHELERDNRLLRRPWWRKLLGRP